MESVASSFTTSTCVKDIGSNDVKLSSNGDDIEDNDCDAEYSDDTKNDNDDCRSTSIFPDIGKNLAASERSDGNNNCNVRIGNNNVNKSFSSTSSSSGSTIVRTSVSNRLSTSNKRITKRCTEIVQRSKAVPNSNIYSFDFDKEVIELRGLYKVSGSTVGLFRPLPPMKDNKNQSVTVSNEW